MGKRSKFERRKHDFYETPYKAILPLITHIKYQSYVEPCAGNLALVEHLRQHGLVCTHTSDIDPKRPEIAKLDAINLILPPGTEQVITNPPWSRWLLHPIIENLRKQVPTWLLFDADWAYTGQARPYLPYCAKIVSVGRLKWIPGSKSQGKDNAAWYLFGAEKVKTEFINI